MSVAAVAWAFDQELPPNQKVVLLALADCENGQSLACMPGQDFIAQKASMSVRTVQRMLIALEDKGLISRDRRTLNSGQRTSDFYTLALREKPHDNLTGGQGNTTTVSGGNTTTVSGTREQEERTRSNIPIVPSDDDQHAVPIESPDKKSKGVTKDRVALPDDWVPTSTHQQFATTHQLNLDLEVMKFKGHAEATGRMMVSWNGAFSTWLGNAVSYRNERPGSPAASGVVSTTLTDSQGRPAPYGLTPGGRRLGPPARAGEHPRAPWLGMMLSASSRGSVFVRDRPLQMREPTENEKRILNGADD